MKRMFSNLIPYTNVHEMNLDWIIENVEEYIKKYIDLETFVNSSLEEQQEYIDNALKEIRNDFSDLSEYVSNIMEYIQTNIEQITNDVIVQMIEAGTINVGITYDSETEALTIAITEGE